MAEEEEKGRTLSVRCETPEGKRWTELCVLTGRSGRSARRRDELLLLPLRDGEIGTSLLLLVLPLVQAPSSTSRWWVRKGGRRRREDGRR